MLWNGPLLCFAKNWLAFEKPSILGGTWPQIMNSFILFFVSGNFAGMVCGNYSRAGSMISSHFPRSETPRCLSMWAYINGPEEGFDANIKVTVRGTDEEVARLNGTANIWRKITANVRGSNTQSYQVT